MDETGADVDSVVAPVVEKQAAQYVFENPPASAAEQKVEEPKIFSPEVRKALEEGGFKIFSLPGGELDEEAIAEYVSPMLNVEDFKKHGRHLITNGEVALKPFRFLEGTENKTFGESTMLTVQYAKELAEKMPGTTATMGKIADYIALEQTYRKETGKSLFENEFVRSQTLAPVGKEKQIRNLIFAKGIVVDAWDPNISTKDLYSVPLVEPA